MELLIKHNDALGLALVEGMGWTFGAMTAIGVVFVGTAAILSFGYLLSEVFLFIERKVLGKRKESSDE